MLLPKPTTATATGKARAERAQLCINHRGGSKEEQEKVEEEEKGEEAAAVFTGTETRVL